VMKKYSRTIAAKARVIPHAMDLEVAPVAPPRSQGGPLRIAHVGNLFVGRRTATALFEALVALNARQPLAGRLEVVFIGEGSGLYEAQEQVFVHRLEPIVTFHPRVAYLESLRMMRESDLLLLIDAPSAVNVFLPSKIVDYFMAGRPLLALTPPAGMSAEIATRLRYPMARPDDAPGIAAVLERLLIDHERGRLPDAAPAATLNEFSLDATAGAFDQLLAEAVAARRAA